MPLISFDTPWKHQKIFRQMFVSGQKFHWGIEEVPHILQPFCYIRVFCEKTCKEIYGESKWLGIFQAAITSAISKRLPNTFWRRFSLNFLNLENESWVIQKGSHFRKTFLSPNFTLFVSIQGAQTLQKKWSFPLRISSVNATKSAGNCGFGHIYWRNTWWKTSFLCTKEGGKSEKL